MCVILAEALHKTQLKKYVLLDVTSFANHVLGNGVILNVKNFSYSELNLGTSRFFCILLVLSGPKVEIPYRISIIEFCECECAELRVCVNIRVGIYECE